MVIKELIKIGILLDDLFIHIKNIKNLSVGIDEKSTIINLRNNIFDMAQEINKVAQINLQISITCCNIMEETVNANKQETIENLYCKGN